MFLDDQSIKYNLNFLSSKLKQNIIHQAASMLLQHINFQKNLNQNSNGNALDEHHRHHIRRTNKCNSWLSKYPTKSDTSLNQLFQSSSSYSRIKHLNKSHYNQLISSSNTNSNIEPTFSQPLMLIHKKRIHRDYFLSTIQNCIQPPYSQNHFYAFDQFNLLKLQQNNYFQSKRKYSDIDNDDELEDIDFNQKQNISQLKTADHISINKYHDKIDNSIIFDEKPESQIILSRLEKILNLCAELRSLANDVESHLQEKQLNNEKNSIEKSQSEQTLIDIYKELEIEQIINEIDENNISPIYEISSIHSESNKSHPLMETESFKTKSISDTILRKPEDLCTCFLKSIFEKENCQLNLNEQEYLNQLTKAYLLGREQILKEQHEQNNKFQAFIDENLQDEQIDANNNNNQSITPLNPSSSLLYNNFEKSDDHLISTPLKSNDSIISLNKQSSTISSVIITAKHQVFINEPIAMKTTQVLPGIGTKYAQQLAECGFSTVRRLLGFYLMIKDDQNFVNWLNTKPQISIYSAWLCTNALRAWCETHL